VETAIVDVMAEKAVLVLREEVRVPGYSRSATGSVRGVRCQPCPRPTKLGWREHRPERCSAPFRNERAAVSDGTEARWAPSSAHRLGAAEPKGKAAQATRRALRADGDVGSQLRAAQVSDGESRHVRESCGPRVHVS
jgi:hypothetical protein